MYRNRYFGKWNLFAAFLISMLLKNHKFLRRRKTIKKTWEKKIEIAFACNCSIFFLPLQLCCIAFCSYHSLFSLYLLFFFPVLFCTVTVLKTRMMLRFYLLTNWFYDVTFYHTYMKNEFHLFELRTDNLKIYSLQLSRQQFYFSFNRNIYLKLFRSSGVGYSCDSIKLFLKYRHERR